MAFTAMCFFFFATFTFGRFDMTFARPSNEVVAESKESYEVDEMMIALPMANSTFLHMLHPNASELIYGDNESLSRNKRCCCCCDCCCCCCCGGGGSGSSEEGVAIGDMIALASLIQANQAGVAASEPAPAVQQSALGYLPYPLVPRSVDWAKAPNASVTPIEELVMEERSESEDQSAFSPKILPGHECVENEDCVIGASCLAQFSWSGVLEKRCVCHKPFLHIGDTCVAPDV